VHDFVAITRRYGQKFIFHSCLAQVMNTPISYTNFLLDHFCLHVYVDLAAYGAASGLMHLAALVIDVAALVS
jgi:hypothetical protein